MKISKIPGLGRFGIFIDDVDFENITDEEWMEIGKLHLDSLVTILRDVKLPVNEYERRMKLWGSPRSLSVMNLFKKYNLTPLTIQHILSDDIINGVPVDDTDRKFLKNVLNVIAYEITNNPHTTVVKVTGKHRPDGSPEGLFAEGELLWHSNESGNLEFSPAVSLLGVEGVVGSATGFLTTADWYEKQSESFRSELDEMILQHQFTPGKINPGLREEQDHILNRNMCPAPIELPLVIKSPGGIKGLHYSVNTINSIKGMSQEDSQKMFDYINKTLFVDEYTYDHWYKNDNDLCLFDNSITLHRRLGGITNRMCYRIQYVYDQLAPGWNPWLSDPYASNYDKIVKEIEAFASKNLTVNGY